MTEEGVSHGASVLQGPVTQPPAGEMLVRPTKILNVQKRYSKNVQNISPMLNATTGNPSCLAKVLIC